MNCHPLPTEEKSQFLQCGQCPQVTSFPKGGDRSAVGLKLFRIFPPWTKGEKRKLCDDLVKFLIGDQPTNRKLAD